MVWEVGLTSELVYANITSMMEDERRKQTEQKLIESGKAEFLKKGYMFAQREEEDPGTADDNERQMMEYLSAHRTEAVILMDQCAGSRYEMFRAQIKLQMQAAFTSYFTKFMGRKPDAELIRILVSMRLQGYMELIKGDYTVDERVRMSREIGIHADAGTEALIKYLNQEQKACRE